jgi:hypothetical protein
MKKVIENLKDALRATRAELKEVWYNDRNSILCHSLLQIETNLERALKELGESGYKVMPYKRPAFKPSRVN